MADLTATGVTAAVNILSTTTPGSDDYRIQRDGPLKVQRYDASSWVDIAYFYPQGMKVIAGTPELVLQDSSTGEADFRLKADSSQLVVAADRGSGFASVLTIDGDDYVYAHKGIAAGTTSSGHVIRWERLTGNTTSGAGTTGVTLTDKAGKTLGAIVMVQAENDQWYIYDCLSGSASGNFYIFITTEKDDDVLNIVHDSTLGGRPYRALVFYAP